MYNTLNNLHKYTIRGIFGTTFETLLFTKYFIFSRFELGIPSTYYAGIRSGVKLKLLYFISDYIFLLF